MALLHSPGSFRVTLLASFVLFALLREPSSSFFLPSSSSSSLLPLLLPALFFLLFFLDLSLCPLPFQQGAATPYHKQVAPALITGLVFLLPSSLLPFLNPNQNQSNQSNQSTLHVSIGSLIAGASFVVLYEGFKLVQRKSDHTY